MSLNYQKLYLDDVFALAKTLFIKSEYSASRVNARLTALYGSQIVNPDQPQTWKYYLNACGQYHSKDTVMQVISLDTLAVIDFTKENLALHPATAAGYQYKSRYYKELFAKYPKQESLILGILYPADMAKMLAAPDYSVVSYKPDLVEHNEEDLISNISSWAQLYFKRWFVHGFTITQPLYGAAFYAKFYHALILKIMELRQKACNTSQAHSFHVKMYLASHHHLDEFIPLLTFKQTMWLYRNIPYLMRHAGWNDTFKWLVDNLLTQRGIPLTGFNLVHNTEGLLTGDITPTSMFLPFAQNSVRTPTTDFIDNQTIQAKLINSATGNAQYDLIEPDAVADTKYALENVYQTKILESSFVDNTEGSSVSSIEIAMSLWAYAACTNRFNVYTRVNHPVTGTELTLSSINAYYVFLYAYAKAHSNGMPVIPKVHAAISPVWPVPTLESLWGICNQQEVSISRIISMRTLMPPASNFVNLDQFKAAFSSLEEALKSQSLFVASADTFERQMSYKSVMLALWASQGFTRPETNTSSLDYFASQAIELGSMDSQQWQTLSLGIFSSITGLDMQSTASQSSMQTAMISIMRRLSSYSILFVDPTTSIASRALGWSNLIIQESASTSVNYYEVPITTMDTFEIPNKAFISREIPIGDLDIRFWVHATEDIQYMNNTSEIIFVSETDEMKNDVTIPDVGVTPMNGLEPEVDFVIGLQTFLDDPSLFAGIPNLYNSAHVPVVPVPEKADPKKWLLIEHMPVFESPAVGWQYLEDFKPLVLPSKTRYFKVDAGIIILDGFESSYGDDDLNVFDVFKGHDTLQGTFDLLPYFQAEVDSFQPNTGNALTDVFDVADTIVDFIEIPTFIPHPLQIDPGMRPAGPLGVTTLDIHASPNLTVDFTQGIDGLDVAVSSSAQQVDLASFSQGSNTLSIHFSQNPLEFDAGAFYPIYSPYDVGTLISKAVIYHIPDFVITNKTIDLADFDFIGTFDAGDLVYWGANHLTVEYAGPTFLNTCMQLDISDAQRDAP